MTDDTDTERDGSHSATADSDPASFIARYIAGSDDERDVIAADHPALITDEITGRAEQTRPGPERTWMNVGANFTTPERRSDILRAIASLDWQPISSGEPMAAPASPGLAINACIRQLRLPRVDQVAWHGSASAMDWHENGEPEGLHYALYGIQANYTNGRARLYVLDIGTATIPLASDFWPAPVEAKTEVSE